MQGLPPNKILNFADLALSLPIETLEFSLKQNPDLVNCTGYGGQTALHKAVLVGNHAVTLILLRCGANPNTSTHSGETSLHIACSRGALKILVALISFGGDLMIPNQNGHYPIHCAALNGSIVVIQFLSEVYGCDLDMHDANGASILHCACLGGHLDLIRFITKVKRLMCLDADSSGNTVLHNCAASGLPGVCWTVLANGGTSLLLARNKNGHTPLQVAQSSLSVSRDCKYWLEKWTKEYEKNRRLSSPKWDWLLLLIAPLIIFHFSVIIAAVTLPERQWMIGVPGFLYLLCTMRKQQHRITHPVRWSNPIYVGAYSGALLSTIVCFLGPLEAYNRLSTVIVATIFILFIVQIYFLHFLVTKDPGTIPSNGYCKDTLIKLSEDRLEGRYCSQCFIGAPSSSHHCRLCESCLLYLDHHCLFLNTCIAANNHWHFVIFVFINIVTMPCFVATCLYAAPVSLLEMTIGDWMVRILEHWLCHNIWVLLLLICHLASLIWASCLLRYQFHVISTQQTTYYRIKSGIPKSHFTLKEKLLNFIKFLYNRRVALASTYIQA